MFKVECDSCRAGYELDERRVPEQGMRMRCPKCGSSFVVQRPPPGTLPGQGDVDFPSAEPTLFGQRAPEAPAGRDDQVSPHYRTAVGVAPPADEGSVIVDLPRPKTPQGALPVSASHPPPGFSLPKGTLAGARAPDASAPPPPAGASAAHGAFGTSAARTFAGNAPPAAVAAPPAPPPIAHATERAGALPPREPIEPVQDKDLSVSNIRVDQLPMPAAELDLPAPQPDAVRRATELVDLPALKGDSPTSTVMRTAPGAGAPPRALVPPRAPAPPLGAPPPSTSTRVGMGATSPEIVDLPAPRGMRDLPALKHGTAAFGEIDLPAPKAKPAPARADEASFGDIELPELPASGDLPRVKTAGAAPGYPGFDDDELPELPASGELPRLKVAKTTSPDFGEAGGMDLPALRGKVTTKAADESSFGDLELPDLPSPRSTLQRPGLDEADFGDIELPPPKASPDVLPPKEKTIEGVGAARRSDDSLAFGSLGPPGGADSDLPPSLLGPDDESSFGDLGFGEAKAAAPPKATAFDSMPPSLRDTNDDMDLDDGVVDAAPHVRTVVEPEEMDAEPEPEEMAADAVEGEGEGEEGYGEVAFQGGEAERRPGEEMEFGMEGEEEASHTDSKFSLPPEILRRQRGEDFEAKEVQRRRRVVTLLVRLSVVLVLIVGAGFATGYVTHYGLFGIFYFERYFPDAGDPAFARSAIERAEKLAVTDTYVDVRRALTEMGRSRHQKGLNRALLTRSIVHHALYIVRFGDDAASASRIAAVMRRLEERAFDAEGMALAKAADAARRKAWDEVGGHLDKARAEAKGPDAYLELLAGEVGLAQLKPEIAEKAFAEALKAGGGARAQWGLARIALRKVDKNGKADEKAQLDAVTETLKLSPNHVEARIEDGRIQWQRGDEEGALATLRVALGLEPTEEDQRLWPSKAALASGFGVIGYLHEARGRLHTARQAYDQALAADAYMVEALLGSARVLIRESRHSDALARFESALGIATKGGANPVMLSGRKADAEAQLGIGRALTYLHRGQEARDRLMKLQTDLPNDPEVALALGETEYELGNIPVAETHYRKAIELAPTNFAGYLALSQLFFKQKEPEKASAVLNDAAAKVAETAEMRRSLGESELARNRIESAVHEFSRALELDPHDIEAMFGLGVALRKLGQLDRSRSLLETIATRDPGFAGLVQERGLLSEARGDFGGAVKLYQEALVKDPTATPLLLRLGAAQLSAGDLDAADQTLAKVIRETPNSAEAEYFIGRVAFARGRTPDALTHFTRAVSLDTGKAEYHLWVARASLEMANLGRTMEEVSAALALDPGLGDGYWLRATVEERTGQVKDALKNVDKALKLNPARTEAYAVRAGCFDQLGQMKAAIASLRIALDREPTRGEWWSKLGRLHLNAGDMSASNTALRRAMELGDKTDPMPYWLPEAYRMAGENAEAANNRQVAIALYKRYYEISNEADEVDRKAIKKKMKEWGVDLGAEQ